MSAQAAKYGWPDPYALPDPAYLIFGSNPSEGRKGRDFYDNPQYYMTDVVQLAPTDRYITVNLVQTKSPLPEQWSYAKSTQFSKIFCESFNTVIFDFSVMKVLDYAVGTVGEGKFKEPSDHIRPMLASLINVLKPGGAIIIDGYEPSGYSFPETVRNAASAEDYKSTVKSDILARFRSYGYPMEIMTFADVVREFPETGPVYGPLMTSGSPSPDREALILRNVVAAGAAAGAGGGLAGGRRFVANSRRRTKRKSRQNRKHKKSRTK